MTEENSMADFRREGEPAFNSESENENSEESPSEENESEENLEEDEDEDKKSKVTKKEPLNENPRWQEREQEWNDRFSNQELQHKKDMEALRAEFGGARQENANNTKIPAWFGGSQEQWDSYRADRDAELSQAEERAAERINKAREAESTAVQEATDYMKTEIAAITTDKALNPTGGKIDPNKLLKIVLDNDLVDSKGRWNYKAGMRIYNSTRTAPTSSDRKIIAAATNSETTAETKAPNYKTSKDFSKPGSRPW